MTETTTKGIEVLSYFDMRHRTIASDETFADEAEADEAVSDYLSFGFFVERRNLNNGEVQCFQPDMIDPSRY